MALQIFLGIYFKVANAGIGPKGSVYNLVWFWAQFADVLHLI